MLSVRYSLGETLLCSRVGVLRVYTRAARHMHTLYQCQWSSHGSNMILVKMSTFLDFNLHTEEERATECKSKEQSFKKGNYFYQSKAVSPQFTGWVTDPQEMRF